MSLPDWSFAPINYDAPDRGAAGTILRLLKKQGPGTHLIFPRSQWNAPEQDPAPLPVGVLAQPPIAPTPAPPLPWNAYPDVPQGAVLPPPNVPGATGTPARDLSGYAPALQAGLNPPRPQPPLGPPPPTETDQVMNAAPPAPSPLDALASESQLPPEAAPPAGGGAPMMPPAPNPQGGGLPVFQPYDTTVVPRPPLVLPPRDFGSEAKGGLIGAGLAGLAGLILGGGRGGLAAATGYGSGYTGGVDTAGAERERMAMVDNNNAVTAAQNAQAAIDARNKGVAISNQQAEQLYTAAAGQRAAAEHKAEFNADLAYKYHEADVQQMGLLWNKQQDFLHQLDAAPTEEDAKSAINIAYKSGLLSRLGLDGAFPKKADGSPDLDKYNFGKPKRLQLTPQQHIANYILSSAIQAQNNENDPAKRAGYNDTILWAQHILAPDAPTFTPSVTGGRAGLSAAQQEQARQAAARMDMQSKEFAWRQEMDTARQGVAQVGADVAKYNLFIAQNPDMKNVSVVEARKQIADAEGKRAALLKTIPQTKYVTHLDPIRGPQPNAPKDAIPPSQEALDAWHNAVDPAVKAYDDAIAQIKVHSGIDQYREPEKSTQSRFTDSYARPVAPVTLPPPPTPPGKGKPAGTGSGAGTPPLPKKGAAVMPWDLSEGPPSREDPYARDHLGRFAAVTDEEPQPLVVNGQAYRVRYVG